MRLFRNPLFRRLNQKLKGIKLTPCIPPSLDQHLAFEDLTPSPNRDEAVLVSTRTKRPSPKNKSPKGEVRFKETAIEVTPFSAFPSLSRAISRFAPGAGPGPRTPRRPPILRSDSECSVMVLKKDMETGEIELDPTVERSPLDEAAYRYHYNLRRILERSDDDLPPRPTTPSPPEDLAAEQYARLHDSGLISTSFDAFRPLVPGERDVPDAKRHSKLASLFDWADRHEADSSMDVVEKYAEETERDEQEVFLEAGLWAHRRRTSSPCSHGKRSASAPGPLADTSASPEADTGFYIHGNHSADHLPSIDSRSTTAFSPEPFSPRFTLGSEEAEDDVRRNSCDSLTTENGMQELDDIMSATSKYEYDFALTSTPSPANRKVSPSAPPNTPWDPASADISVVDRAGQECRERRRSMKNGLDKTYSFISFSSPLRVSLEAGARSTHRPAAPVKPRTNFAAAFSTPRSKASTVNSKRAATPLLSPVTVSTAVGTDESTSKLEFTKLSPDVRIAAKTREGVFVSSFAEDLNKALDVLDSLASSSVGGDGTPGLSVGSARDERSECPVSRSPVSGSSMSRFSEELASSDTDEGTPVSRDLLSRAPRRRTAGGRGNGGRPPSQRGTRKLQGAQFGFRTSRQYRRILELYTLQYQMY